MERIEKSVCTFSAPCWNVTIRHNPFNESICLDLVSDIFPILESYGTISQCLKVRSGKIGRRSSSPNQVNCWVFFSEPSKLLALFGIKQEVIGFSSLLACFECSILISLWFSAWFGKLSPKYRRRYSRIMFYGTVRFAVCLVAINHWPAAPGERRLILQCSKLRLYRAHLRLKISRLWLKFV